MNIYIISYTFYRVNLIFFLLFGKKSIERLKEENIIIIAPLLISSPLVMKDRQNWFPITLTVLRTNRQSELLGRSSSVK